jgi:hypothetical protein
MVSCGWDWDNLFRTKTAIERQIQATDKQIDQIVYELYDLAKRKIESVKKKE